MKRINDRDIILFEELTQAALNEPDAASCVSHLLRREQISGRLAEFSQALDQEAADRLYMRETQVIDRLEQERKKLILEIDNYSKQQKAVKSYSSKFPLPPSPQFFNNED
ncbi:MAG: hypothetical protein ACYDHW_08975 [Syntrophorhabdaceae bacterium]